MGSGRHVIRLMLTGNCRKQVVNYLLSASEELQSSRSGRSVLKAIQTEDIV